MKAQRAERVMVYSFSNLGARWGWVVNATPRLLYLWEGNPAPIVQEPGWPPGPAWTSAKNLVPTGFDPRTAQAVVNALYLLRHPGPQIGCYVHTG